MRLLILSEIIDWKQRYGKARYTPSYDVQLGVNDPNETERFSPSIFDYDVSFVHITKPQYHTMGYYQNLPKILQDVTIALEQGRTVICLPQSLDFVSERLQEKGMSAYEWLRPLGVELQDNIGEDIRPSGAGRTQVIQGYLKYAPKYYQIIVKPKPIPHSTLAVVDDTEIIVGLEHQVGNGTLVILPPPLIDDNNYFLVMPRLVDVARRYYERSQRRIYVGDAPPWVESYLVSRARALDDEIKKLGVEKEKYDRLAYVLYGTGEELEFSVALLLDQLGLEVKSQPKGANIDLKARHPGLGIGFAVEVVGTKGIIQKDGNKIPQAWEYLKERVGTDEEKDRLMIVANTECHLDPKERRRESFTPPVVKLLGDGVLLITTLQLYELWKMVDEDRKSADDVIQDLYKTSGIFGNLG